MLFLAWLSLLAAYNLDLVMRGQISQCAVNTTAALVALPQQKVLLFFLIFTGLSALAVFAMAFGHDYIKYRSDMQHLTPYLETPMPTGQGQYGTARWLEPRRIPEVFTVVTVDEDNPLIRKLIQEGTTDLPETAPPKVP